jgi:hypothetical protein
MYLCFSGVLIRTCICTSVQWGVPRSLQLISFEELAVRVTGEVGTTVWHVGCRRSLSVRRKGQEQHYVSCSHSVLFVKVANGRAYTASLTVALDFSLDCYPHTRLHPSPHANPSQAAHTGTPFHPRTDNLHVGLLSSPLFLSRFYASLLKAPGSLLVASRSPLFRPFSASA